MARLAAAIIVVLLNLLVLAAISFICGGLIAVFDSINNAKPLELLCGGMVGAIFGVLLFGAPIALIAAIHTWTAKTDLHQLLLEPRIKIGLQMLMVTVALAALVVGILTIAK